MIEYEQIEDLGAVTETTRGIPVWMHEESTGEMDYRD